MDISNQRFLVVGAGVSGKAATKLLITHGAKVLLYDENLKPTAFQEDWKETAGLVECVRDLSDAGIDSLNCAVLSPGVPMDCELVGRLQRAGVPIWGEIELAYAFEKGKVAAITGTNGKTTTTALTGEILKGRYEEVLVVGNIGIPYTEMVGRTTRDSVTVAEVSSFQLETIHNFRPLVSAILNVTPDHLDRHHTMEEYLAAKRRITENQGKGQVCVLNYEDSLLRKLADELEAEVRFFSSGRELEEGVYLEGESVVYRTNTQKTVVCDTKDLQISGKRNYENAMVGIAIGAAMGVPFGKIREALFRFQAIEHRIEFVLELDGVKYYNDSKATNTDSAICGIQAMDSPTWLIGGGYDKEAVFDEWIGAFDGKVRKLVLLGKTREKIAEAASRMGFGDYVLVDDLEEAVRYCGERAQAGESVLLSPACASWDMFTNYEERGRRFKELVVAMAKKEE